MVACPCVKVLPEDKHQVKHLLQSTYLHADETGLRFNGNNSWMHVISNKVISFFAHHLKRGKQAMNDIGLLDIYKGTLIHDRLAVTSPTNANTVYAM